MKSIKKNIKILFFIGFIFQIIGCNSEKKSLIGVYYLFGGFENEIILISGKDSNWKTVLQNNYDSQKSIDKTDYYRVLEFNNDNFIKKDIDIITGKPKKDAVIGEWNLRNNKLTLEDQSDGIYKIVYKITKKENHRIYLTKIDETLNLENDKYKINVKLQ